jgi:glycosyltransferase involved in cell wall biosynthesis
VSSRRSDAGVPGLVSVVVPFFDPHPGYLAEAVESVVAQTYQCWELILMDDGSRDPAGVEAARSLAASLEGRARLVSYERPGNLGISAARNEGVARSAGEYIAFLDADDVFLPCKLETEVGALRRHPAAGMVCTNSLYWHGGDLAQEERDFVPDLGRTGLFRPPGPLPRWLRGRSAVPSPCSTMLRRCALDSVGGYEAAFRGLYEDQVVLAKMCMAYPVVLIDAVTARYRQHSASICAAASTDKERVARRAFLSWLQSELEARFEGQGALAATVRRELWLLDHPVAARALRMVRRRLKLLARLRRTRVQADERS